MVKVTKLLVLIFLFFSIFLFNFSAGAKSYPDWTLLRAKSGIKVYLINGNIKKWVSILESMTLPLATLPSPTPPATESIPSAPAPAPAEAEINDKLPAPDYIRADW